MGRGAARALLAVIVTAAGGGCAVDDPGRAPAFIIDQPADTQVFDGQGALFRVRASGNDGLRYEWRRNGIAIPGATDAHLAISRTVPADDGAIFSAVVTNVGGPPVESRGARLTVLPPLDLRFQWVGAPFAPRYTLSTNLLVGMQVTYFSAAGSPLLVGSGICGGPGSCSWFYEVAAVPGMNITYEAGSLARLPSGWAATFPSDTVVTSLDLQEASGAYAMSRSRTTQVGAFTPVVQGAVPPDQLQAVATAEGAQGRVLTAVSFQGGLVTYVSYGWSLDTSTVYETRVVATPFAGLVPAAEGLAAEGYVITACGAGNDGANGLVLVGTRAQGSTAPRSIVFPVNISQLDGHALVAFVFDAGASTWTLVGER